MEWWKWVVGYKGYYQGSTLGRVRSVDRIVVDKNGRTFRRRGRILRPGRNADGYLHVGLCKNGVSRTRKVHQLVAAAFLGPCPDGQIVRHGLGGKLDNSVSNLCYGTLSENGLDRVRDGTTNARSVRRSDGKEYRSMTEAARDSGCWVSSIWGACNGELKTSGGFGWEYI
jgi:hypothetical protein